MSSVSPRNAVTSPAGPVVSSRDATTSPPEAAASSRDATFSLPGAADSSRNATSSPQSAAVSSAGPIVGLVAPKDPTSLMEMIESPTQRNPTHMLDASSAAPGAAIVESQPPLIIGAAAPSPSNADPVAIQHTVDCSPQPPTRSLSNTPSPTPQPPTQQQPNTPPSIPQAPTQHQPNTPSSIPQAPTHQQSNTRSRQLKKPTLGRQIKKTKKRVQKSIGPVEKIHHEPEEYLNSDEEDFIKKADMKKAVKKPKQPVEKVPEKHQRPPRYKKEKQEELLGEILCMAPVDFAQLSAYELNRLSDSRFEKIPQEMFKDIRREVLDALGPKKQKHAIPGYFANLRPNKQIVSPPTPRSSSPISAPSTPTVPAATTLLETHSAPEPVPEPEAASKLAPRPPQCGGRGKRPLNHKGLKVCRESLFCVFIPSVICFKHVWEWGHKIGNKPFDLLLSCLLCVAEDYEAKKGSFDLARLKKKLDRASQMSVRPDVKPKDTLRSWKLVVQENIVSFCKAWSPVVGRQWFSVMMNLSRYIHHSRQLVLDGKEPEPFDEATCLTPKD